MNNIKIAIILPILLMASACDMPKKTEVKFDGYSISQNEKQRILYGRVQALEHRSSGESYSWLSSLYEMRGTVTIIDEYNKNENLCKKFSETVQKQEQIAKTIEGVACKVDGVWGDI